MVYANTRMTRRNCRRMTTVSAGRLPRRHVHEQSAGGSDAAHGCHHASTASHHPAGMTTRESAGLLSPDPWAMVGFRSGAFCRICPTRFIIQAGQHRWL